MNNRDMDPLDKQAVMTIGLGMLVLWGILFLITRALKFRFVMGVGD